MEEEECAKMLNHLQQYVPHLEKLIVQLKDPKKKNRELQLSKLEGLHSMITDRKKKLKLDTLKKCEDVILKILQKVHPTVYKQFEQSEPRYTKFLCKDPPSEKSFLSDDDLLNSTRLQAARARLSEISTPASPSPPRDITIIPPPIVIPTEKINRKIDNCPWERREDRLRNSNRTEIYRTEKPDIYRRAAESLSTKSNKDPVLAKVDMSVPPLSAEDLQELTEPDNLTVGELENLRDVIQKKIVKEEMKVSVSKTKHHSKSKESEKLHSKPRVEKIYKDPDTQFGNLLSSIDVQILEKKEDRRFKSDSQKKDKKHSKDKKKDYRDEEKKEKQQDLKPVFKRLADKYNPKPRKNSIDITERLPSESPSQFENFSKEIHTPTKEIDVYQGGNNIRDRDHFQNPVKDTWTSNFLPQQRDFPTPRAGGNTYMNTFIVQNNIPHQYPIPSSNTFHSAMPPVPKIFHPYEPIQSNEYELNKIPPVEYYPHNYQNQRPGPNRTYSTNYGSRDRSQFPEHWPQDPRNATRREDPRLANRDPRIRSREQKEKNHVPGPLAIQAKRKSIDDFTHSKFDSLYADRPKTKEETFVSPLDSLYSVSGESSQKTGKGYGVQKFRIPKKKQELDEEKNIDKCEEIVKNEEENIIVVETSKTETIEEKVEEETKVEDKKVEDKEPIKASPTDQSIIADFITNLIQGSDKKDILTALVSSLAGGVSDQQKKKFKRIQKIMDSDSEPEEQVEVKLDLQPEPKKEENEEEVDEKKDDAKKVVVRKKAKRLVKPKKVLQRKSQRQKAQLQQKLEEESLQSVVETVGERIKNRRRTVNTPKARKSTELDKLHKDIKEMFICDGVLTATGKRMCRILKSDGVNEDVGTLKDSKHKDNDESILDSPKRRARVSNPKVLIEKTDLSKLVTSKCESESDTETTVKTRSQGSRRKTLDVENTESTTSKSPAKRSLTPRAKTKPNYAEPEEDASSVTSSVDDKDDIDIPIESAEKKGKKKRRGHNWAIGIITKKSSKKKVASPIPTPTPTEPEPEPQLNVPSPDPIPVAVPDPVSVPVPEPEKKTEPVQHDKNYFYDPHEKSDCKICSFKGKFIVQHYKTTHPTHEVLISRISPENAQKAIEDCLEDNYDDIEPTDMWETETRKKRFNYRCRFCQVFFKNESTDTFFDHVTSHTGEYRFHCRHCTFKTANNKSLRAHFHSSHSNTHEQIGTITPVYQTPPNFSMVFGYICQDCHYVQLNKTFLENHVKNFHTDVKFYKINMSTVVHKGLAEKEIEKTDETKTDDAQKLTEENKIEETVPEEVAKSKEDPTVFKYNPELVKESIIMDEQKHEKMKEINQNIIPKKKLSFDLLDKIKSRLDDKVEEKMETEVSVPVSVAVTSTKSVDDVKPLVEVKKPLAKIETKAVVEKAFLNKNSVPITTIIERLQGKLNSESQPPPLIPINAFAANIEPKVEEVQIQVGPIAAKKKSDYTLYMCYMLSCMYSSTTTDEFDAHCVNMHGNKQWDGFCGICSVNTGLSEVQEAFHHLLLAHKNELGDEKNEAEIKSYLRMRRLSGDKLSELKVKSTEPDNPVISMSEESPFKIVNVQAQAEEVEEENFFPFQISSVTTLTPEEDQALNTPHPTLTVINTAGTTKPTTIPLQNSTYSLVLPVLSPISTTSPKSSPTKILISSPKRTTPSPSANSVKQYSTAAKQQSNWKTVVLTDVPLQAHEIIIPRKTTNAMKYLLTEQKLMHLYKCPKKVCTFSSNIKRLFEIHLRQHTDLKPGVQIPCLYCNFKSDVSVFTVHYDVRHGRCQYCCVYCFYRAINQSYVEMHQEREHPKNPRKVLVAPLTQDALSTQVQAALQPMKSILPLYVCGQLGCNKKFIFSSDFANHYDTAHGAGLYPCCYCSYIPSNGNEAVTHMQVHNVCRFHCRYCQYGGKTLAEVHHHLSLQHCSLNPKIIERVFIPDIKSINKTSVDYDYEDATAYDRLLINTNEFAKYITTEARIEYTNYTSNRASKKVLPQPKETITLYKAPSVGISSIASTKDSTIVELSQNKPRAESPIVLNKYLQSPTDLLTITKNLPNQKTNETAVEPSIDRRDFIILQPETVTVDESIDEPLVDIKGDDTNKAEIDPLQVEPSLNQPNEQSESFLSDANSTNITEEELSDFTADDVLFSEIGNKKQGLVGKDLFRCSFCAAGFDLTQSFKLHVIKCVKLNKEGVVRPFSCNHCSKCFKTVNSLLDHIRIHGTARFACSLCDFKHAHQVHVRTHMKTRHSVNSVTTIPVDPNKNNIDEDDFVLRPKVNRQKSSDSLTGRDSKTLSVISDAVLEFGPEDITSVPLRPIFNKEVKCSECGYATKVRANLIRHFQFHKTGKELPIPATAPVNPVPCLDKNEKMFDKMINLSLSSYTDTMRNLKSDNKPKTALEVEEGVPMFVASTKRYTCGANNCDYLCLEESMLRSHLQALHSDEIEYKCTHCHEDLSKEKGAINIDQILKHLRMHDLHLYKCNHCKFIHYLKHKVDRHVIDKHGDPMIIIVRELEHEPEEAPLVQEEVKETKPWRCGICKYRCSTNADIIAHVFNKHDLDSQFKCALCQYRSNVKNLVGVHFVKEHPGQMLDVIDAYYEEGKNIVSSINFDTTPIWQREKNKFKHIRGIPIDETNRVSKKSPAKTVISDADKSNDAKKVAPTVQKKPKTLKDKKLELIKNDEEIIDVDGDFDLDKIRQVLDSTSSNLDDDKLLNATLEDIEQLDIETLKVANIIGSHGPLGKPNNKQYLCPICNTFKTRKVDDITHHLYKEVSYPRFVCTNCGLTGITYNFLKKHSEKKHLGLPEAIHPLSPDPQVEDWVSKVLSVQGRLIANNESAAVSSTTLHDYKKTKVTEINVADSSSALRDATAKPLYAHQCRYCTYNCKAAGDLRKHERRHWVQKPLKCGYCDTEGVTNYEIHQHSKRSHPNMEPIVVSVPMPSVPTIKPIARKRKFPKNDSTISSSSDEVPSKLSALDQEASFSSGMTDEEETTTFVCGYCSNRFASKAEMQSHWELTHKDKGLYFKYKEVLNEQSTKKGTLNYKCSYCAFVGHLELVKNHFKTVHPNLSLSVYRYKCEYCGKYFRNIDKIRVHYKSVHQDSVQTCFDIGDPETPGKDFVCKHCNMDFDDRLELEDHHNTFHSHLDLTTVPNNTEQVVASTSGAEKKSYKCPAAQCNYYSNNYPPMRDHVRVHAKPFQCGYCSLRGIYPSIIKAHHNKEHPNLEFNCTSSPEGVALYNNLKQNIMTLNKNKEYEVLVNKQKRLNVAKSNNSSSAPPPKKLKVLNVARKSTTQVKPIVRKETARKSTTQILPKVKETVQTDYGFSYYGNEPDLEGAENLNTSVMFGNSYLKINFVQLQGLFDMFPVVPVVDIKNNVDEL